MGLGAANLRGRSETLESLHAECQGDGNLTGTVTTVVEIMEKGPDLLI